MTLEWTVDIEIYSKDDTWAQARYLAHGITDVCWTNDLHTALKFLANQLEAKNIEEADELIRNPLKHPDSLPFRRRDV